MTNFVRLFILSFLIIIIIDNLTAQSSYLGNLPNGGEWKIERDYPCMTPDFENKLHQRLERNRAELVKKGILKNRSEISQRNSITKFEWPLRQATGFDQASYYDIQNFVDLNSGSGIQDYNCGERSYDGHNGIDIDLWPFWWHMMENDQVEVVAGAFGTIIGKDNGNSDMNCSCIGEWNAVYVEHQDGTRAYYGHLKKNTLTSKTVGSDLQVGDYIGIVGSSGCSSNPHLHLEIREVDQTVIEPFQGSCNSTVDESWWVEQLPYRDPTLNVLYTHDEEPGLNGFCPSDEEPNFKNNFAIGELAYLAAYYHDQDVGTITQYSILDPNGNIMENWSHESPSTYTRSYWYWTYNIPNNAEEGEWTFEATYNGKTVQHKFNVSLTSGTSDNKITGVQVYPNPTTDQIYIKLNKISDYYTGVINLKGEYIKLGKENNTNFIELDISEYENGVYLLEIQDQRDGRRLIQKIVKSQKSN